MRKIDPYLALVLILFVISLAIKLYAAQDLIWDYDVVPVIGRGMGFFESGTFPAYGTLSSIGVFNMPGLVWMQMPVMVFSKDIPTILIVTQLFWNLIGTLAIFRLGRRLFNPTAAVIAAAVWTFSEFSITGSFTAWAQLHLPTFTALLLLFLYEWYETKSAQYFALAIITASGAFMIHFSAIMFYPLIFVFWLLIRPPLKIKGLLVGGFVSLILLSPYLSFQIEREFQDLKGFVSNKSQLSGAIMESVQHLKPEAQLDLTTETFTETPVVEAPAPATTETRILRRLSALGQHIINLPLFILQGFITFLKPGSVVLEKHLGLLGWLFGLIQSVLLLILYAGMGWGFYQFLKQSRLNWATQETGKRARLLQRFVFWQRQLSQTENGKIVSLSLLGISYIVMLWLLKITPQTQSTYFIGLSAFVAVLLGVFLEKLRRKLPFQTRIQNQILVGVVVVMAVIGSAEPLTRIAFRDEMAMEPFNIWRYERIESVMAWIAADTEKSQIRISYDLLKDIPHFWWVAAFHAIDPAYRTGMAHDYLLKQQFQIMNENQSGDGLSENPDYIVVLASGMERYQAAEYEIHEDGIYRILKPKPSDD